MFLSLVLRSDHSSANPYKYNQLWHSYSQYLRLDSISQFSFLAFLYIVLDKILRAHIVRVCGRCRSKVLWTVSIGFDGIKISILLKFIQFLFRGIIGLSLLVLSYLGVLASTLIFYHYHIIGKISTDECWVLEMCVWFIS